MITENGISKRLKEARRQKHLRQRELADMIGVTVATISSYERNDAPKTPSVRVLIQLAEALGVSLNWLCGVNDNLTTYQDIIRVFEQLGGTGLFSIQCADGKAGILFEDKVLCEFLTAWKKVFDIFKSGLIDEELCPVWISHELEKDIYQKEIRQGEVLQC